MSAGNGKPPPPSISLVEGSFAALRACGIDLEELDKALAPFMEVAKKGFWNTPLGLRAMQKAAGLLGRWSGDARIGLRLAREMPAGSLGVVDYLMRTAPTLRHANEISRRFAPLVHDYLDMKVTENGGVATLRFVPPDGLELDPVIIDFRVARVHYVRRALLENPLLAPLEVHFSYPRPRSVSAYAEAFGHDVRLMFGQEHAGLVFPASLFDAPLPGSDPGLHGILIEHAERALAEQPHDGTLSVRLKAEIAATLHQGRPNIAEIARSLRISERTIRRRLMEEGTGFAELVDVVRAEMANFQLSQPGATAESVALSLGFESASAFRRARQRWRRRGLLRVDD